MATLIKGYALVVDYQRDSFATLWSEGFGSPSANSLVPFTETLSVFSNVLIANTPQLLVSLAYMSLNGLLTCMVLTREFSTFGVKRSGLRVTFPEGEQRSTFWLSLPYRFSIPLLVASTVLHWALSQTLFLAEVTVRDPFGDVDHDRSVSCVGWSALALVILLVISSILIIVPVGLGFLRYPHGVPIVESCSIAMSAACHPLPGREGEAKKLLKYGVIGTDVEGNERAGLSSSSVAPLVTGNDYI